MSRVTTLIAVGVAIGLLAMTGCRKVGTPPVTGNATADSAEQVLVDMWLNITNDGVLRGTLFADTAYVFNETTRYEFRNVRTVFNKADGSKDGVMRGRRARYDIRQAVLEGYGAVEITTNDGRRLTSPHLRYDQGRNLVSSDSAFTMVANGRTQRGVGFEADPQLTRFQCKSNCGGSAPVAIPMIQ